MPLAGARAANGSLPRRRRPLVSGPRPGRLSKTAVEQVFVSGRSFPLRSMVVKSVWREDGEPCRLAVVAGKSIGGAVRRNRARRRLRGAFQRASGRLPEGLDVVVLARGPALTAEPAMLEADIEQALERIEGQRQP